MFFNIEFYHGGVTPKDLMAVRTEVLTKLILHKRERIIQSLPELISQTGDEKHTAEKIARKARRNKENLESKITKLKTERKVVTQGLNDDFSENLTNKEQQLELSQLLEALSVVNSSVEEFNKNLEKLTEIVESVESNDNFFAKLKQSSKANAALGELDPDYLTSVQEWNEVEGNRRKLESRFTKLSSSLTESKTAAEFWQSRLNDGFEELLIDAKRVADGGPSSRQINRMNRNKNLNKGA
jgi:flagellar biosynthesis chaperone FliJ